LFMVNGWKPHALPKIVPSDVDSPDINQLGSFMQAMAGTGVTWFPDGDLENFVREAARLPKLDKDQVEQRRQMQMRNEASQFAQANMAYVQAQQQEQMAEQGQMPLPGMEGMGEQAEEQAIEKEPKVGGF
jgi:hypothetical protein